MNLNVASTKLQSIVEEASRKKSLINSDRLKVVEGAVLGAGASATVFRGSYRDQDVAVKAFRPVELCDDDVEKIGREIGIVAGLRHRNVVYLHGLCVRPPAVCAVYEFCDHDLSVEIRDRISDKTWTAEARWRCTIDVLSGIAYAHAKGVWHRDVKLENIFVKSSEARCKLGDFGLAVKSAVHTPRRGRSHSFDDASSSSSVGGTEVYQPPECFEGNEDVFGAVDAWGLGCVLFEMATSQSLPTDPPFLGQLLLEDDSAKHSRAIADKFLSLIHISEPTRPY